jgi:hypothetical protein
VVDHLTKLNARPGWSVAYSVGFDLDERVRAAIGQTPEAVWEPALDAAGDPRPDAQVAELTGLLRNSAGDDRLAGQHADPGAARKNRRVPAAVAVRELSGYHYQVIATATSGGQPQRLEARHRVQARVEGFIRCGKDTGLARWPSYSFAINTAAAIAIDLLCWMRLLPLDGPLAKAEPAALRYRLLHAAARLVKRSRHLILRVPQTWPWAQDFAAAVNRVRAIP